MKTIIGICIVILLILPTALFAGDGLSNLKMGTAATVLEPYYPGEPFRHYLAEIGKEDLAFGADIRWNISLLELSCLFMVFPMPYFDTTYVHAVAGAGLSMELLGLLDIGVTAGSEVVLQIDQFGLNLKEGSPVNWEEYPLVLRATADINLGSASIGAHSIVHTGMPLGAALSGAITDLGIHDLHMQLGAAVLFRLF